MLNVLDLLATLYILDTGIGIEINPLLDFVYQYHPILFILTKSILAGGGLVLLWFVDVAHAKWAEVSMYLLMAVYLFLVIYQINGILMFS